MKYTKHVSAVATPQSEAIPGEVMIANEAGGHNFPVDDWARLDRFCLLGSENGTYYSSERELTKANAEAVLRCIKADGLRTVASILDLSNRAPKADPSIFALAMAAKLGDEATRKVAFTALPGVCRIGTHLLQFAECVKAFGGWGQGTMNGMGRWFTSATLDNAAYQAIKYRQREGWAMADLLRKTHPVPPDQKPGKGRVMQPSPWSDFFNWVANPNPAERREGLALPRIVEGFERAQGAKSGPVWASLIREYNLPREALPTEALNELAVWEALLERMPMTAMIRNLGKMSAIGLVGPFSAGTQHVVAELNSADNIKKARVHPWQIIVALQTYKQGHGMRAQMRQNALTWTPVPQVIDALDTAFQLAFGNVQPTGKRILLAIDVSGSMGASPDVMGVPGFKARDAAAAMAFIHVKTEPNLLTMAFDTEAHATDISKAQRVDDVLKTLSKFSGGTDCSVPMVWADQHKLGVDAFLIYTDEQTWAGQIHPIQAVVQYRKHLSVPAKLVSAAMTPTGHSIVRQGPEDGGSLSVVGFDAAAPTIIGDFLR